ncbi:hypothetical protein JCM8097_007040 [Rhodosporidiobolus ruineniae]
MPRPRLPSSLPTALGLRTTCAAPQAFPLPHSLIRRLSTTPRVLLPPPRSRLGGAVKLAPEFDWKKPPEPFHVPKVDDYDDPDKADEALQWLVGQPRISLGGCEAGLLRSASSAARYRASDMASHNMSEGIMSFTDDEGIIVLHLAKMKRAPRMVKQILEDPTIEKQIFGAAYFLLQFLHAPDFFDHARPTNVTCLRSMAYDAYPQVLNMRGQSTNAFNSALSPLVFDGLRFTVLDAGAVNWHTKRLQGPSFDQILKDAWYTHCAAGRIRAKLIDRVERKAASDSRFAPIKGLIERLAEVEAAEAFTMSFDEFEAAHRAKGRR